MSRLSPHLIGRNHSLSEVTKYFLYWTKEMCTAPCPLGAPAVKSSGTRSFTQNPGFPADMTIRLKLSKQKIKTLKIPTDRHWSWASNTQLTSCELGGKRWQKFINPCMVTKKDSPAIAYGQLCQIIFSGRLSSFLVHSLESWLFLL